MTLNTGTARSGRLAGAFVFVLGMALVIPPAAEAQAELGAGFRFAFLRNDTGTPEHPRTRLTGGMVRLFTGRRTAIEVSFDYRSHVSEDLTQKIRELPIQGSLLLYLFRSSVSPYILGGIGWYSESVDRLDGSAVRETTTARKVGYHAGLGGELQVHPRAVVHLDYRYTFIRLGAQPPGTTEPGAIPIPGLMALQEKMKLSHEGSMWTTGITFFF